MIGADEFINGIPDIAYGLLMHLLKELNQYA